MRACSNSNQIFVSQEKNYHFWHEHTQIQRGGVGTGPPRFPRVTGLEMVKHFQLPVPNGSIHYADRILYVSA